ncbi:MAG: hypothetical protein LRY57_01005 [Alphaproteobacteria bacterium]|nr:hypothetical protein [Alphaproteobacteria bacterium]
MLNDNLGANLPRGELTKQLKDFDGRGHSQTYRHDQSEHITASGLQTTTGARGGVLAEDGQALYRRAGNFSSSEVAAFGDAKDKLDSLINLVSPGGEEPGPIDGKIQGEAIGNGEGWVTKSGRGYADPTAQTQHRVPGIFVSLRDQLTSSDPNLVNLNRQNQFWDRLGEVCKSPLSGDMQTILKDALGVLPPGTENRLPADVRRELGFENSKPQKPDYERPDIRIQYELKGAPEILREAFNDKVNPAIMAEAQRNLGGIKIREYFLESDMKADFLAAEGHGDPTLKYQAMRRIGEEVASWGGDVNIEVGIGLIQAASEGGGCYSKADSRRDDVQRHP